MSGGNGDGGSSNALSRSRVSAEQLEILLSFMEEHIEFAAGKQAVYSRFSSSKLWRLLAERLNAAAPESAGARKSPDKWCRYWADIKYKARKKCAAGGALGELSSAEERLRNILNAGGGIGSTSGGGGRASNDDDERKPPLDDDAYSDASLGGDRLATEELLAEAAMRSALAAEKQAEAVSQGVELLRELVSLMRSGQGCAAPCGPPPCAPCPPPQHDHHQLQHHHHRL